MGKIESFEELECWKSAKDLTIQVYAICNNDSLKTEFTAKDQLKRAALSSMNNIAEGFGRFSNKESIRFYNISTASLDEVIACCYHTRNLVLFELAQIQHYHFSNFNTLKH